MGGAKYGSESKVTCHLRVGPRSGPCHVMNVRVSKGEELTNRSEGVSQ